MTSQHPAPARRRRGGRTGSSSLEFALVVGILMITCIGVVNLGLLLWTQEVLESAAAQTARCAALGSTVCNNSQNTPALYAVSVAAAQSFTGVIGAGNVSVLANATCASTPGHVAAGNNTVVTITSGYWSNFLPTIEPLVAPLRNKLLTATACYPSSAP